MSNRDIRKKCSDNNTKVLCAEVNKKDKIVEIEFNKIFRVEIIHKPLLIQLLHSEIISF